MDRDAVTVDDVRIGMRRCNVLTLDEIEVMLLEASGGFTCITRKQMADGVFSNDDIPECLQGLSNFKVLHDEAKAEKQGHPTNASLEGGPGTITSDKERQRPWNHRDIEAARHAR